ncbi:hypothetical protein B0H14DRAFT_3150995 [Mycena olivaceomarginata]|nr:hypothetical protein B0H14DRAFT_3150995 [Mycena olivaceomarginata]
MTTRSPSVSSFSSSSPNESKNFSPYAPRDPVTIPDVFSHYSGFKYRVWFIWHIWEHYSYWDSSLWPLWLAVICGPDGNGDLWLWEEEDEEGIREFAIRLTEPFVIREMTEEDWDNAFQALKTRFSRTTVAANPVAHLPSKARLRFMAWLLVVLALRGYRIFESPISRQDSTTYDTDPRLGRSVLPVWIETMSEVYLWDDLRSLPWPYKCNCLHSQLTATANTYPGQRGGFRIPLDRNSPVLHLLYELFVPTWPLILWVVYRTGANDRAEYLTTFMDILRGPDQDLFTWDDADESKLIRVLANKLQLTLYPQDWIEFMVEIPLETWLQIGNMTRIDGWNSTDDDTPFRVAAVLLKYLPTPMTHEKILTTLGIKFEDYGIPFDTMARAVDRDHQNWSALAANFNSEEFCTSASLRDWLSACDEALCHGVWHTPMPLLERVHLMVQANNILPCVALFSQPFVLADMMYLSNLNTLIHFFLGNTYEFSGIIAMTYRFWFAK